MWTLLGIPESHQSPRGCPVQWKHPGTQARLLWRGSSFQTQENSQQHLHAG